MMTAANPPEPSRLLDHDEDPYHAGVLEDATHVAEGFSRLSGDAVRCMLRIRGDVIDEAWCEAEGCRVCQAAASILCEVVEGMPVEMAREYRIQDYLRDLGDPVPPARRKCVLLAWRVFQAAIDHPIDDDELSGFGGPSLGEES